MCVVLKEGAGALVVAVPVLAIVEDGLFSPRRAICCELSICFWERMCFFFFGMRLMGHTTTAGPGVPWLEERQVCDSIHRKGTL